MAKLSPRDVKVVKAKVEATLKGKSQAVAAQIAFPNQKPRSAESSMSEALRKPNIQEAVALSFKKHGIDIDSAVKPIADGLEATSDYYDKNGEEHSRPDHAIRLKASGMVFNLMGAGKQTGDVNILFIDSSAGQKADYDL